MRAIMMSVPILGRPDLKSGGSLGSNDSDAAASSGDTSRSALMATVLLVVGVDRLPVTSA